MTIVIADGNGFVALGKQGENNATEVRFPVAEDWAALFGEGVFQLLILRPTEATPYAVPVTVDGANVCWAVSGTDVSIPGIGGCELRYTVGETLAKSETYVTLTEKAIGGTDGPYPTPWEEWVDHVMQAAAEAEAAQVAAELAETHAEAAQDAAEIAQGKAETAQEKAEDAQEGAETAQGHAEAAQGRAEIAQRAAETAQGKAEEAEADAIVAKNAAQTAQRKSEDAQTAAESAQTAAETAQGKAETAQGKAEDAQTAAETAQGLSEAARDAAQIAKTAAETAQSKAETAQEKAEAAQTAAETAQGKAEDAQTASETAQTAAETAQGLAEAAQTAAETAQGKAEDAQTASEAAQTAAETAQGLAEAAQIAAETAAATFSTDTTLTVSGKAADAKATGTIISNVENGVNSAFVPITGFNPTITKGSYFKSTDGATASSNSYCRTTYLNPVVNNTSGRKIAFRLTGSTYEFSIAFYDGTGTTSGTGYILSSGYMQNYIYIPSVAVLFGISFRRVDRETITDSDVTAIKEALSPFAYTDISLSTSGAAADAKATGDKISNARKNALDAYPLAGVSGKIAEISDGAEDVPAKNIEIAINPMQAGTGYPSSENIRPLNGYSAISLEISGKNIASITSVPTSTGNHAPIPVVMQSGIEYRVRYQRAGTGSYSTIYFYHGSSLIGTLSSSESQYRAITLDAAADRVVFNSGSSSRRYYDIFITVGSNTGFQEYSGAIYTIQLPEEAGTVYSGYVSIDTYGNAILYARPYYAAYNGETLVGPWISDRDVYSQGATPTTGAQVIDLGGEYTEYSFTSPELRTVLGYGYIAADTGNVNITYRADPTLYIARINNPTDGDMVADANIADGTYFIIGNTLYLATTAIAQGETITPGTNCTKTDIVEALNALKAAINA